MGGGGLEDRVVGGVREREREEEREGGELCIHQQGVYLAWNMTRDIII